MNEWTVFVHKCTDVRKIKYCWIPSYLLLPCKTQGEVDVELINPLTPKSDWHLISPYCITSESKIKVRRIKELITN